MEPTRFKIKRWLLQPDGSSLCGQTCVAMIANIGLNDAIEAVGKKGETSTKDIARALWRLGFSSPTKLSRVKGQLPMLCMCALHSQPKEKFWHWTIFCNGLFYDPVYGFAIHKYPRPLYITSYLPIHCKTDVL